MNRWNHLKESFPAHSKKVEVEWSGENFLQNDFWVVPETGFIFLHWTAFNLRQRETIGQYLRGCKEGTVVITLTNPIPGEDFEVLIKDSW